MNSQGSLALATPNLGPIGDATQLTLTPLVDSPCAKVLVILAAYVVTLATSGLVVRWIAGNPQSGTSDEVTPRTDAKRQRRLGRIIGKCENIIAVTFILTGQATGLALIFAAKSIVRRDDIKQDPDYYLGGTLVNLVWALIVAMVARTTVLGL